MHRLSTYLGFNGKRYETYLIFEVLHQVVNLQLLQLLLQQPLKSVERILFWKHLFSIFIAYILIDNFSIQTVIFSNYFIWLPLLKSNSSFELFMIASVSSVVISPCFTMIFIFPMI